MAGSIPVVLRKLLLKLSYEVSIHCTGDPSKKFPNKIPERKRFVGLTYQKVKYLLMKYAVVLGLAKV